MDETRTVDRSSKPYDPAEVEPHWYPRWLEAGAFLPQGRAENGPDACPMP